MKSDGVMLLGFTVPEQEAKDLFANDSLPAVQTHKFAWSLAFTLQIGFGRVVLASSYPIQNYPKGRRLILRGREFHAHGMSGLLLGFINIIVVKHLTRFLVCLWALPGVIRQHRIRWIVVHGVHTPFLMFGVLAKLFGKKFVVMLTDPPGVVLPTDGIVSKILKRLDAWLVRHLVAPADAIFALAPELAECIAPGKPTVIFPGILERRFTSLAVPEASEGTEGTFTIVYAGGLNKAYGVDRLIDAVVGMQNRAVRLKLFGRGDQEAKIRKLAASDSRLVYGGFLDNEALIPELCGSDLLVNPRPTDLSFAAQSFPSKLIEYLSTGRPVLTTRIRSIPASYRPYFYYVDDETVTGIQSAIERVMALPMATRNEMGRQAQKFVRADASEQAIGIRIEQLLTL